MNFKELCNSDHSIIPNLDLRMFIGCNYHVKWQSDKSMRFILSGVDGKYVTLATRTTAKLFKCKKEDIIYINNKYNNLKAAEFMYYVKQRKLFPS